MKHEHLLSQISDAELLVYCTSRLLQSFKGKNGFAFNYGQIVLSVHEGTLTKVEEIPKFQSFRPDDGVSKNKKDVGG